MKLKELIDATLERVSGIFLDSYYVTGSVSPISA